MFCPHCGAPNPGHSVKCNRCGGALTADPPPAAQSTRPRRTSAARGQPNAAPPPAPSNRGKMRAVPGATPTPRHPPPTEPAQRTAAGSRTGGRQGQAVPPARTGRGAQGQSSAPSRTAKKAPQAQASQRPAKGHRGQSGPPAASQRPRDGAQPAKRAAAAGAPPPARMPPRQTGAALPAQRKANRAPPMPPARTGQGSAIPSAQTGQGGRPSRRTDAGGRSASTNRPSAAGSARGRALTNESGRNRAAPQQHRSDLTDQSSNALFDQNMQDSMQELAAWLDARPAPNDGQAPLADPSGIRRAAPPAAPPRLQAPLNPEGATEAMRVGHNDRRPPAQQDHRLTNQRVRGANLGPAPTELDLGGGPTLAAPGELAGVAEANGPAGSGRIMGAPAGRRTPQSRPSTAPPAASQRASAPVSTEAQIRFEAAPLWRRLIATIVDGAVVAALIILPIRAGWFGPVVQNIRPWEPDDIGRALFGGHLTVPLILGAFVFLLLGSVPHGLAGRTLGKLLTGLMLVNNGTGSRPGWPQVILRQVVGLLTTVLGAASYCWLIVDRRSSTLHDRLSGTSCVISGSRSVKAGYDPLA